jgi:hypothetical protein
MMDLKFVPNVTTDVYTVKTAGEYNAAARPRAARPRALHYTHMAARTF